MFQQLLVWALDNVIPSTVTLYLSTVTHFVVIHILTTRYKNIWNWVKWSKEHPALQLHTSRKARQFNTGIHLSVSDVYKNGQAISWGNWHFNWIFIIQLLSWDRGLVKINWETLLHLPSWATTVFAIYVTIILLNILQFI